MRSKTHSSAARPARDTRENRNTFRLLYDNLAFELLPLNRQQDDVSGHDLDDVHLQEPPDEELQLMEVLQELEEQDREPVHHQVPFILRV